MGIVTINCRRPLHLDGRVAAHIERGRATGRTPFIGLVKTGNQFATATALSITSATTTFSEVKTEPKLLWRAA